MRNLMYTAIECQDGPFVIRYPRGAVDTLDWKNDMAPMPIGKSRCMREGADVAVLSIGTIAAECAQAIDEAARQGVRCSHYDMLFLKPIDEALLHQIGKSGMPVLTVEDGTLNGGLGSVVASFMTRHGYNNKLVMAGIADNFVEHGSVSELKAICGIDASSLAAKIINLYQQ